MRVVAEARRARQAVRVALPLTANDAHDVYSGSLPLTAVHQGAPRRAAVRRGDWVLATAERHLRADTRPPLLARPAERVLAGTALVKPWVRRTRAASSALGEELGLRVESEETNLMLLRRTQEWARARVQEQSFLLRLHAEEPRGAAGLRDDWVRVVPLWHSDDASPPQAALPPGDEATGRGQGGRGAWGAPESFAGAEADELGQLAVDDDGHLVRLSPQALLRRIGRGDSSLTAGLLLRQLFTAESLEDMTLLQGGVPAGEGGDGGESEGTGGGALARIRAEAESREKGNGPLPRGVPALRLPASGLPTTALPPAPAPRTMQRAWRFCAAVHVRSSLVRALRALSAADFALAEIAAAGLALGSSVENDVASVARAAGLATWPRPDPCLSSAGLSVAFPSAADVEGADTGAPRLLDPSGTECVGVAALRTLTTVARAVETAATRLGEEEVESARTRVAQGDKSLRELGFSKPEEVSSDPMAALVTVAAAAAAALEGRAWLLAALARASRVCADGAAFAAVVSWAAEVGKLPALDLHSRRALTDSALRAASLHYAAAACAQVVQAVEREADAVFHDLPGARALLLDAAAVQCCRDAAAVPVPALGLAPRVALRLRPTLRAISARRMTSALAREGEAVAGPSPLVDGLHPGLIALAGSGAKALVTAVPGAMVRAVVARAGADPAGAAPTPEVFACACRAALRGAQFATVCAAGREVETVADAVLEARRGSLRPRSRPESPVGRPAGDAQATPGMRKKDSVSAAAGMAHKLGALTLGEGRALSLAARSLLRLADTVAAVGSLLAGSGHPAADVLDATRPLRLTVENGVADVKAALDGVAVDAQGRRQGLHTGGSGSGDGPPLLDTVAVGLEASAAQWEGTRRQLVAVAAARRVVNDMALHGLVLKGHSAAGVGGEPGFKAERRQALDAGTPSTDNAPNGQLQGGGGEADGDGAASNEGGRAKLGAAGPVDSALVLWSPAQPPAGVDSSCVLGETEVDVERVEPMRSIPRLAEVCTEQTGTSADQARLWAALGPLLHAAALVDAAKAQGGAELRAAMTETALTACVTAHGALDGDQFAEWTDLGAGVGRSLWHIAATQAYGAAVQLGSHAAVDVCAEAGRVAASSHGGGDVSQASALLLMQTPGACKRAFLGTWVGLKPLLVSFLCADVSQPRGWAEARAALDQAQRVLLLLCRRHRALRAIAELHTLRTAPQASPATAAGAAGEGATPCLAPQLCPNAWTAPQAATDRFATLMSERARMHCVPLPAQLGGGEAGPLLAPQTLAAAGTDLLHCLEGLTEELVLHVAAARCDADAALLATSTAAATDASSGSAVRAAEEVLQDAMRELDRVATPVDAESGQVTLSKRVRSACLDGGGGGVPASRPARALMRLGRPGAGHYCSHHAAGVPGGGVRSVFPTAAGRAHTNREPAPAGCANAIGAEPPPPSPPCAVGNF